jgi:ADP-heptose:LPS heptosyltransferase
MHILIIRPGAIGDTLLTFPIIQALKACYQHADVTLVSNPAVLPLAQAWHVADEVADYGDAQWSDLFSSTGIRSPIVRRLLQRTAMTICWLHDADGLVKRNLLAAGMPHVIVAPGRPPEGVRIHIVEYLAQTVKMPIDVPTGLDLLTGNANRLSPVGTSIGIHPGSGGARKCWPVSHFAAVIRALWVRGVPVLLLAGPADRERVAGLLKQLPSPAQSNLLNIVIDAPLLMVAELLQGCKGYLGNDSGITHLAALLGVPTIALFGPSDPAIWRPLGSSVCVLYEPVLENLPVNMVIHAIEHLHDATRTQ